MNILELAAGPAAHAIEFARRGHRVTAIDSSASMCRYAREKSAECGVAVEVIQGDMTKFTVPQRHGLAIAMLDSISHILSLNAAIALFESASNALTADGVLVLEVSHPADWMSSRRRTRNEWNITRDDVELHATWGHSDDVFDVATQQTVVTIELVATRSGSGPRTATATVPLRHWTETELVAAASIGGWAHWRSFGAFDVAVPFSSAPSSWRLLMVFTKTNRRGGYPQ